MITIADQKPKARRGFAAMSPEKRRTIASMGGKSVPAEKRSFSRDPAFAAQVGHIGGSSSPKESRAFFKDRDLARRAGAVGGSTSRRGEKVGV